MDRQLTAAEREAFSRDGVVHIRGAVDPALAQRMLGAVDRWITGSGDGAPRGLGMDRRVYAHDDEFRSFVFESGLAAIAGDALDSEQVRIYFDQIFVKGAETARVFPWHQDHPYWPIRGTQVCSTWVALTAATVEASALEFVAGSHRWGTTFRPVFGDGSASVEDLNRIWDGLGDYVMSFEDEIVPFEDEPERYRVIGFSVEPGDALLFDYRTVHRSRGNSSGNRRVAVSWRWLGDDAIWAPVPGADPVIGPEHTTLLPGDLITDDATFPAAWRARQHNLA